MFDYQTRGCTKYGAQMGRRDDLPTDTASELRIRRVPLDQGYDPGGAYWGSTDGEQLYCVFVGVSNPEPDHTEQVSYVRAANLAAAKACFPNATWLVETAPSPEDIDDMLEGYVACALFSSNDESDESGGVPLDDNYSSADVDPATLAKMRADVAAFLAEHGATIAACIGHGTCDYVRAGRDLWFTRNQHGMGFDDGDWPEAAGEVLSEAARKLGNVDLYVDDGKIYA